MITLYFASDLHGSDRCFRKFLNAGQHYGADVLVLGGDVAGKGLVPVVDHDGRYRCNLLGEQVDVAGEDGLAALEARIRFVGNYPYRCSQEELTALHDSAERQGEVFMQAMVETFRGWLDLAAERLEGSGRRCIVMLGNDDPPEMAEALSACGSVEDAEAGLVDIGEGFVLVSCGYSNRTPWDSPRELDEAELDARLSRALEEVPDNARAVCNFHVPPYASQLDLAPAIDKQLTVIHRNGRPQMVPVGSTAVRSVLERYQPPLGLHGHVHESRGIARIGRTVCLNPGSEYGEGILHGAFVELKRGRVRSYQLVAG